jgi:hypothetical protein
VLDTGGGFLKHLEDAANAPLVELTAASMLAGLGAIGSDGVNVGRNDLLLPPELLARLAARAGVPLLSANAVDPATRSPFPGWLVREIDGQRVGIFGITGPAPQMLSPPRGGVALTAQEPIAAARRAVAELRRTCRLVIALSQLGLEEDARLAREVAGIDVILGGHTRALTPVPRIEGSTLILHAGAKGMRLGRLELEVAPGREGPWVARDAARGGEPRVYAWTLVQLDGGIPDHPALATLLERHREELRARHLVEQADVPPTPPTANPPYVGAQACGACHPEELRQWSESGHARALASLERKRQDLNPECVRCHVTAFGEPGGYVPGRTGGVDLANVQCEACHGFGREHRGRGRIRVSVSEAVCRRCHTTENSPTFRYEPYLRKLGAHAGRYFARRNVPPAAPSPR